jgi:hypothetical protein
MRLGDYLRNLGRPVMYWPSLCPLVGGVNACILLCHLIWWSDHGDDPDGWIYKTQAEIEAETGLTRREQDTARAKLVDLHLLAIDRRGVPPVLHYLVDLDALESAWIIRTEAPDRMHKTAGTSAPKRQNLTSTKKTKEVESGAVSWARRHGLTD